ncbi:MAG: hypothetical protein QUS35_02795, partial [bacterium]|nr:hypothetical protein [bacterium]
MRIAAAVTGIGLSLTLALSAGAGGNRTAGADDRSANPARTVQPASARSAADDTPGTLIVEISAVQYFNLWAYGIYTVVYDSGWNIVAGSQWNRTFGNLPPGDYYIMAGRVWEPCEFPPCHPFNPYPDTYYPDSPDREHALPVHLAPGETKPVTVVIKPLEYVRVNTSPQGFRVDGTNAFPGRFAGPSPMVVPYYTENAIRFTVPATEPGPLGGTFFFDHWDAGGSGLNCCAVPAGSYMNDFTAYYVLKYRFDPLSEHGAPWGAGWYEYGGTVPFGVESPVVEYTTLIDRSGAVPDTVIADSAMFRFRWWQGTGLGHYTGQNNPS